MTAIGRNILGPSADNGLPNAAAVSGGDTSLDNRTPSTPPQSVSATRNRHKQPVSAPAWWMPTTRPVMSPRRSKALARTAWLSADRPQSSHDDRRRFTAAVRRFEDRQHQDRNPGEDAAALDLPWQPSRVPAAGQPDSRPHRGRGSSIQTRHAQGLTTTTFGQDWHTPPPPQEKKSSANINDEQHQAGSRPEPHSAIAVDWKATASGETPTEQAHSLLKSAVEQQGRYIEHIAPLERKFTPEGYAEQLRAYGQTEAGRAPDTAEQLVTANQGEGRGRLQAAAQRPQPER